MPDEKIRGNDWFRERKSVMCFATKEDSYSLTNVLSAFNVKLRQKVRLLGSHCEQLCRSVSQEEPRRHHFFAILKSGCERSRLIRVNKDGDFTPIKGHDIIVGVYNIESSVSYDNKYAHSV